MQTFHYPHDYLNQRGNIHHCWEVHRDKMISLWLPYVDYNAFYSRLRRQHWDLYKAIHTPLDYTRLEWHEKAKVWIRTKRLQFKSLFKPNEVRRSKGHKNSC